MKRILALSFLLVSGAVADDLKLTDGTVYKGYKVVRLEADGLSIEYADGLARVDYEKLPAELRAKYGWKPEAVKRYRKWKEEVKTEGKPQNTHEGNRAGITVSGVFSTSMVDLEKALIELGCKCDAHQEDEKNLSLSGLRFRGLDGVSTVVKAYHRKDDRRLGEGLILYASQVIVASVVPDESPQLSRVLAGPAAEVLEKLGKESEPVLKWVEDTAKDIEGRQIRQCDMQGMRIFVEQVSGKSLRMEFVALEQ